MLSIKRTNKQTKTNTQSSKTSAVWECVGHVCVGVCVLGGERNWVFASTALVVVWTDVCLTGYTMIV